MNSVQPPLMSNGKHSITSKQDKFDTNRSKYMRKISQKPLGDLKIPTELIFAFINDETDKKNIIDAIASGFRQLSSQRPQIATITLSDKDRTDLTKVLF